MANKQYFVDLDGQKLNILKDWRMNPLTAAQILTLASSLNGTNTGLMVWDTTNSKSQTWDGTAFVDSNVLSTGALIYKGGIAFDATAPATPATGWFYKFTTGGVNTWNGSNLTVVAGDEVYYSGSAWELIANESSVTASETVAGIAELATQAEVNAITDDARIITPLKLGSYVSTKQFARSYFSASEALVANTPKTITHGLALSNKNAFNVNVMASDSQIVVDIDSVDVNSITITSNIASTVSVFITGF